MILNLTLRQREIHLNDVKRELRSGVGLGISKPCIRMWDLDRVRSLTQHCQETAREDVPPSLSWTADSVIPSISFCLVASSGLEVLSEIQPRSLLLQQDLSR